MNAPGEILEIIATDELTAARSAAVAARRRVVDVLEEKLALTADLSLRSSGHRLKPGLHACHRALPCMLSRFQLGEAPEGERARSSQPVSLA